MEINRREVYRYLGYKGNKPDEATVKLVEESICELAKAASPKFFHRSFPLHIGPDDQIDFTYFKAKSKNLARNLTDCSQIILFAATLGAGVDLLVKRYHTVQMSKAVVLQAAAAAMIESYCDEKNEWLKQEYGKEGYYLRPRFSPGYGDFSLEHQRDLVAVLEAGKRVGITLTDSCLMVPTKSVTAVIGASKKEHQCELKGCEACKKTDCLYRRD